MAPALFTSDGGLWIPSELARGPWDPGALHAGPVAALLVRALEQLPERAPMRLVRVTLELFRPVPLAPLGVSAEIVRDGRRVQYLAGALTHEGAELCRMTAWRVRRAEEPVAEAAAPDPPAPLHPDTLAPSPRRGADDGLVGFGSDGVEYRWVEGDWGVGPSRTWFRLRVPLLAGEEPSPAQRAVALADFGNGVSAAVPWETHTFVNTDLTVFLDREPGGEWVGLAARTRVDPAGAGVTETELFDLDGRAGRALQALYVARR